MFEITPDAMVTILGFDFYVMAVTGYAANGGVYVDLMSANDSDARTMALVKREEIFIG